jgi:8-oxo-dGTP diphosphatase
MRNREYPESPLVGVGGVVIADERVLLVRRASEPMRGEWSIPGGLLETGETIAEGVARELREETGLTVRVLDLVEALDRIFYDDPPEGPATRAWQDPPAQPRPGPRYHFVILDYLCEVVSGELKAGGDASEAVFASEEEIAAYRLSPVTLNVIRKGFAMARVRRGGGAG